MRLRNEVQVQLKDLLFSSVLLAGQYLGPPAASVRSG